MRTASRIVVGGFLATALLTPGGMALGGKPRPGGGGGSVSPNAAIAWVESTSTGSHLMLMEMAGANAAVLQADVGTANAEPSWSADGTEIVFSAQDRYDGTGIYRRRADGTGAPVLVHLTLNTPSHRPRWAATPHGDKILFHDSAPYSSRQDLWCVDPSGANPKNLTASLQGLAYRHAGWSRDGSRIAVSTVHEVAGALRNDLLVYEVAAASDGNIELANPGNVTNVAGSHLQALGDDAAVAVQWYEPDWRTLTDGSERIVVSVVGIASGGRDNADLWEIDPDSPAGALRLTTTADVVDASHTVGEHHPAYSGAGDRVLFWRRGKGGTGSGIYSMPSAPSASFTRLWGGTGARDPSCKR